MMDSDQISAARGVNSLPPVALRRATAGRREGILCLNWAIIVSDNLLGTLPSFSDLWLFNTLITHSISSIKVDDLKLSCHTEKSWIELCPLLGCRYTPCNCDSQVKHETFILPFWTRCLNHKVLKMSWNKCIPNLNWRSPNITNIPRKIIRHGSTTNKSKSRTIHNRTLFLFLFTFSADIAQPPASASLLRLGNKKKKAGLPATIMKEWESPVLTVFPSAESS